MTRNRTANRFFSIKDFFPYFNEVISVSSFLFFHCFTTIMTANTQNSTIIFVVLPSVFQEDIIPDAYALLDKKQSSARTEILVHITPLSLRKNVTDAKLEKTSLNADVF